jgi:signal transduction histidine kinase
VLSDRGLVPALHALADRSSLPVSVVGVPEDRLPESVEVAVYYVVSESLANIAKHARATTAEVNLTRSDGSVTVVVADDGLGGAAANGGGGLRGLADRVEALSGRLRVESAPGAGTKVIAEIPLAARADHRT